MADVSHVDDLRQREVRHEEPRSQVPPTTQQSAADGAAIKRRFWATMGAGAAAGLAAGALLFRRGDRKKEKAAEKAKREEARKASSRATVGMILGQLASTVAHAAKPAVVRAYHEARGHAPARPEPAGRRPAASPFRSPEAKPKEAEAKAERKPRFEKRMAKKSWWELLKQTYSDFSEDNASKHAAALAYYGVFSIAPILVIVTLIVGLFLGDQQTGRLTEQLQQFMSPEGAAAVSQMIQGAFQGGGSTIAWLGSIAALVFAATNLFGQLQDSLNTVWEVRPKAAGWSSMIWDRATSFLMVLGVGVVLLALVFVGPILSTLAGPLSSVMPNAWILQVLNVAISFALVTLFFAMIYKVLPDVNNSWKDVWVGAAVTALLFVIGKVLFDLYIGYSAMSSAYGAIGSILILLLWAYYSATIFLLGAEFTQVYSRMYGTQIVPAENAEPLHAKYATSGP